MLSKPLRQCKKMSLPYPALYLSKSCVVTHRIYKLNSPLFETSLLPFSEIHIPIFPRFTQLPLEIRNMIWAFAFSVPQLLVFTGRLCSRSQINDIVHPCREARAAAQLYKLDYYTIPRRGKKQWTRFRRNYINLHLDTIWLDLPAKMCHRLPVRMRCVNCYS